MFRFSVYCHRIFEKFQKGTFECTCDVFCRISARGLMSLKLNGLFTSLVGGCLSQAGNLQGWYLKTAALLLP